ncbi:TlpA family protein disulfide reductase [Ramlibacter humi]|uniref:TlpA family protein disulfide reductase n=1 Tax=Ramlibacter humi TaxID=2530451 RepID=A0A4Z0BEP5_9BURK|nr:TlpA disulfide reductase family protein [Ramlibacter humi]TFY96348.1 TlpA family protein disulfide reductase [Ramlibacter humi]
MSQAASSAPASSRRRNLVIGGVGAAAALGGAGLAWWLESGAPGPGSAPPAGFWDSRFDMPQGGELALASLRGRTMLLNFWATWCPPCVEEMPLLDQFQQKSGNRWQVVGLAIDQPSAVRQFLARTPVRYPIGMAGLGGTELAKALGNLAGGLPFTVVLGPDGQVRQRRMGKLSAADLDSWASAG